MGLTEYLSRASLAGGQHQEATANVLHAVRAWLKEKSEDQVPDLMADLDAEIRAAVGNAAAASPDR